MSTQLACGMVDLARTMCAESDTDSLLELIAQSAVASVPGATAAGISELAAGQVSVRAATDPLVADMHALTLHGGDGPWLSAVRDQRTVRVADLVTDPRWPDIGPMAARAGVRSVLSVQLFVHRENLGSLTTYGSEVDAFDDDAELTAICLAAHAAVALHSCRTERNLRVALESRDVIGQAKGVLIERFKISADSAFQLLVTLSQRTHRKLRDLAEDLVASGEFPPIQRP